MSKKLKKIELMVLLIICVFTVVPSSALYHFQQSSDLESELRFLNYDEYDSLYRNEAKSDAVDHQIVNNNHNLDVCEISDYSADMFNSFIDAPWPMKCHDNRHTGLSPYSTADNPYDELWCFETEGWINGGPVVYSDGIIYFGDLNADFYAIYLNGTLKWKYSTDMWIWSTPAIAEDGTIYITSYDDYLHAINPNGSLKWKFHAEDSTSSPAIAEDGTIYFGTMGNGNNIFAVNPNGTEKWRYPTGYYITSDPAIGEDGTIYIGSGDNYLYALYPNSTLRWKFPTGHYVKGPPSIADDGTIYVGSWDDYLYAINPDGTEKWRHEVGAGTESNPSIGLDGTIYAGGGALYAIYQNGTRKWTFDFGENRHSHQSSPAISEDGTIYIGIIIGDDDGGEIIAVNPDGTERWRRHIAENEVQSSPCIGNDGTVYIGSASTYGGGASFGHVYAFGRDELVADTHGPYHGIVNEYIQLTGTASGGYLPYSYHWDFGDEQTSEEQNPTHEYSTVGNFTVTLTVTDDNDIVAVDTTWALIIEDNNPPSHPTITGETDGKFGESYEYTFTSIDPEDHDVFYYIEWGDDEFEEWTGPYDSGEEVVVSHTWEKRGKYTIKAKAKDVFDYESEWGTLEVTMPVNQPVQYPMFHWFLERFPNAFPILRQLFEL